MSSPIRSTPSSAVLPDGGTATNTPNGVLTPHMANGVSRRRLTLTTRRRSFDGPWTGIPDEDEPSDVHDKSSNRPPPLSLTHKCLRRLFNPLGFYNPNGIPFRWSWDGLRMRSRFARLPAGQMSFELLPFLIQPGAAVVVRCCSSSEAANSLD